MAWYAAHPLKPAPAELPNFLTIQRHARGHRSDARALGRAVRLLEEFFTESPAVRLIGVRLEDLPPPAERSVRMTAPSNGPRKVSAVADTIAARLGRPRSGGPGDGRWRMKHPGNAGRSLAMHAEQARRCIWGERTYGVGPASLMNFHACQVMREPHTWQTSSRVVDERRYELLDHDEIPSHRGEPCARQLAPMKKTAASDGRTCSFIDDLATTLPSMRVRA